MEQKPRQGLTRLLLVNDHTFRYPWEHPRLPWDDSGCP